MRLQRVLSARYSFRLWLLSSRTINLDVGCGMGRLAIPLARYLEGGSYEGLDNSVVPRAHHGDLPECPLHARRRLQQGIQPARAHTPLHETRIGDQDTVLARRR
jgi:hypothetical protein